MLEPTGKHPGRITLGETLGETSVSHLAECFQKGIPNLCDFSFLPFFLT